MKKAIILITITIMILSLTACTSPTVQETPAQQVETSLPTLAPTAEPSTAPTPTPEPSPTPEPKLSPEELAEQQAMEEYEKYKDYYERYNDTYALFLIKDLVDEGLIQKELLGQLHPGYLEENIGPDGYWLRSDYLMTRHWGEMFEKVLNGRLEIKEGELDGQFDIVMNEFYQMFEKGELYVSVFETFEEMEQLDSQIIIINKYFENPTEENLEEVEEMLFTSDIKPGIGVVTFEWFWWGEGHPEMITKAGKDYQPFEYFQIENEKYGKCLFELDANNRMELRIQNETDNPEDYIPRDWITVRDIKEALATEGN